jgi:hypothetical protein
MKKILLSSVGLFLSAVTLNAQVPVVYYDFDNNGNRNDFQNVVEQQVNASSSTVTKQGSATAIIGVSGAGVFNGGSQIGQALGGDYWDNSSTDPGGSALSYFEFHIDATGLSGMAVSFDNKSSNNGPAAAGILWSTDGVTFNPTQTISSGNGEWVNSGLISLANGANNARTLTIRIYGYAGDRTGRSAFDNAGLLSIDNLTVYASTLSSTVTLLDYPSIGASLRANTNLPYNPVYSSLEVNGSGITVSLNTTLQLAGVLTLTNGELNTNNALVLKSSANNTARLAPVTAGRITGDVTVERFINSSNNRAYRLIGPSVNTTGSIHANWQENALSNTDDPMPGYGTHITGSITDQLNGFDGTTTGQQSLFIYNHAAVPQTWQPLDNTQVNTLNANTAYLLYVRGDRTTSNLTATSSCNTVLRATGKLVVGSDTLTGLEGNGRFSLVTNPYASPISILRSYNDFINSNNFEKYFSYWSPKLGTRGGFVTVDGEGNNSAGESTNGMYIQSGQSFFVKSKVDVSSPTLVFKEDDKTDVSNINVFRTAGSTMLRTKLLFDLDGSKRLADGVIVVYDNSYSKVVDGKDAEEIANFDENIAIARDGKMLSIESRPLIQTNDSIPLSIARLKQQQYEWQFEPSDFNAPTLQAYLQDKFLNTQTPISLSSTTVIPFTVTTDAASSVADRFTIVFSPASTLPVTMSTVKAYQKASGIQVEWSSVTENNIDRYEVEKSTNGQQFIKVGTVASTGNGSSLNSYTWFDASPNAGSNYYRIRSVSKAGSAEFTSIVRVALTNNAENISVYPNPVKGNVVGLQLNNLAKGNYTITITNQLGQPVYSKTIEHQGGSASQTLQTETMAAGIYQVKLAGERTNIATKLIKQ